MGEFDKHSWNGSNEGYFLPRKEQLDLAVVLTTILKQHPQNDLLTKPEFLSGWMLQEWDPQSCSVRGKFPAVEEG